jgi:hypothetical protein
VVDVDVYEGKDFEERIVYAVGECSLVVGLAGRKCMELSNTRRLSIGIGDEPKKERRKTYIDVGKGHGGVFNHYLDGLDDRVDKYGRECHVGLFDFAL